MDQSLGWMGSIPPDSIPQVPKHEKDIITEKSEITEALDPYIVSFPSKDCSNQIIGFPTLLGDIQCTRPRRSIKLVPNFS